MFLYHGRGLPTGPPDPPVSHAMTRQAVPGARRNDTLRQLRAQAVDRRLTVSGLIALRRLYLRVSVTGFCNLRCAFCHSEGGPRAGRLPLSFARSAIAAAAQVGFDRVQFTGGEPLLVKSIAKYISAARESVAEVGVTTNGVLIPKRLPEAIDAGLTSLHVSVISPSDGSDSTSGLVPSWLPYAVTLCSTRDVRVRLNLPVSPTRIRWARGFLEATSHLDAEVCIFALIPQGGATSNGNTYLDQLEALVSTPLASPVTPAGRLPRTVTVRSYLSPTGLRCSNCPQHGACHEASRSLRLGVDRVLRPCLATREWDSVLRTSHMIRDITDATILACDF